MIGQHFDHLWWYVFHLQEDLGECRGELEHTGNGEDKLILDRYLPLRL